MKRRGKYIDAGRHGTTNFQRAEAAFAIEQGLRAIQRYPSRQVRRMREAWAISPGDFNRIFGKRSYYGRTVNALDYEQMVLADAVEQGLRALERFPLPLCGEHGCRKSKCAGQYHANGKTRHGVIVDPHERCWCGLTREAHVMPERDFRPCGSGIVPLTNANICEAKS